MTGSATRRFINEVGNEITIEVSFGDAGKLCRFAIIGPESSIESYVTRTELWELQSTIRQARGK
jgi:hypothetical protein